MKQKDGAGLNEHLELVSSALKGNRRSLGKLITHIESGYRPKIPFFKSWTLGVTGSPGAGKSTLIGALASKWLEKGEKVAILAVDPSSPKSGGALLGDRMRMQGVNSSDSVFVRSIATRNHTGGLSSSIGPIIELLSASGWTRIILETVGSGQSQVRIIAFTDRILLVEGPDRGDVIQAEKAGILELADIIAINKSDIPTSKDAFNSIKLSMEYSDKNPPLIHLVSALNGDGINELLSSIEKCPKSDDTNIIKIR